MTGVDSLRVRRWAVTEGNAPDETEGDKEKRPGHVGLGPGASGSPQPRQTGGARRAPRTLRAKAKHPSHGGVAWLGCCAGGCRPMTQMGAAGCMPKQTPNPEEGVSAPSPNWLIW